MATPVQGTARAYVFWVKFQIQPGEMDQFMPLMLANARTLQAEPAAGGSTNRHDPGSPGRLPLPGAALTSHIDAHSRHSRHSQPRGVPG